MVNMCLEITTTRDIARQILRHRSFSFQEFSQRYADPLDAFSDTFEIRDTRFQDEKNRQNSIEMDYKNQSHQEIAECWEAWQEEVIKVASRAYEYAIDNGIAKEQARAVLPEGLTKSRLYMNGTLRSWIHYCSLRSANGTQKEHQEIAIACAAVIAKVFPLIDDFI